jgi:hypothetical protein
MVEVTLTLPSVSVSVPFASDSVSFMLIASLCVGDCSRCFASAA